MSQKKAQGAYKERGAAKNSTITDQELAAAMNREREELERTWARPKGLRGWFSDTDHKAIALRYIVTAFIFFLLHCCCSSIMP